MSSFILFIAHVVYTTKTMNIKLFYLITMTVHLNGNILHGREQTSKNKEESISL